MQLINESLPDLLALNVREVCIVELHVDARNKGVIKGANSVGSEEQYAVVEL